MTRAALSLWLLSTVSAFALSAPTPGVADPHVRQQPYDPMNRTQLVLTVSRVSNITFSPNEQIKRALFGDENAPASTLNEKEAGPAPMINNLPLFGKVPGKTDLVVITSLPDGHEHTYQFAIDVHAAPKDGSDDPDAIYGLEFTYAVQEKAAAVVVAKQTWKEKQDAKMKETAEARLNTDVFYGLQNWRYMAQGQFKDIVPVEIHDNGRLTAFRYPGNMAIPSVFIVSNGPQRIADACTTGKASKEDSLGTEQVPQTSQMDDMVLVQQTAAHIRLRSGEAVVEIYNCGWDPIGVNPGTGTTSPEVVRRVVSAK
jgi:type IV secretion system protein VirB9